MSNHYISYISVLSLLLATLCACNENDFDTLGTEGVEDMPGVYVERTSFTAGDVVTRSTLVYGKDGLDFKWELGDKIGMYTTAMVPTKNDQGETVYDGLIKPTKKEENHPDSTKGFLYTDPTKTQQACYKCTSVKGGGLYALIDPAEGDGTFNWYVDHEDSLRWSVYSPYDVNNDPNAETPIYYNALPLDFTGQTQKGFVNMRAYYTGGGFSNTTYIASEEKASKHLGEKDYVISAETTFSMPKTYFHLRHLGAIARFFLLAPAKDLELISLRLICDNKIFYTKGIFDLTSRPYVADATKGLCLVGDAGDNKQMAPVNDSKTNNLLLHFDGVKIDYTNDTRYGNYLIAYLMMYPITYNHETDGNLYAYVTAKDKEGKELHFVSAPLADKDMVSGRYYQWTSATHEDDGLYPIELTATLKSWQDIVGGDIDLDLTK